MEKQAEFGQEDPQQPLKILIGRLIDGTGSPARKKILMTIERGCIAGMRPFFDGEALPEGLLHDLSCYTVMPPLMDCHVHLAFSGSAGQSGRQTRENETLKPAIARHIQDCLQHGVMGVRDGGDPSGNVLHYKITDFKTKDNGFRLNAAGTAWHRGDRYGKLIGRAVPAGHDPLAVIVGGTGAGIDHIKLIQSGLNSLTDFGRQTPPQFDAETIRRIYSFSRRRGFGLMIHANGETPVAEAIAGGCDSIEHGYFMGDENLRKMRDARITWVPTAMPMKAYADHSPEESIEHDVARRTLDHQLEQLSKARDYGVQVALGTDSGSPGVLHGKAVPEELKLLMAAGYTPEEAVSCATLNAARLLETDLFGYLDVGLPATFIVVKGNGPDVFEPGEVEMMVVEGAERKVPKVR